MTPPSERQAAAVPTTSTVSAGTRPKGKKLSAAQRAKRQVLVHRWIRFGVQAVFFILAPGLFSAAFNGVKYLATQIGLGAPVEATSFLVLLVLLLAFTVLFGRFFCGFACAFGTLGDVLYASFAFLRSKTSIPEVRFPEPLVRVLFLVKYLLLAAICAAAFFGVWSGVSGYSPWVAFAGLTTGSVQEIDVVAFVLLGLVVAGMIVRERFFCQFLCPMGAVFALMPVLGFSEFSRNPSHCARSCGRCRQECPVDIWPDVGESVHGECIACGRCADVCPMCNVNLIAVEKPEAKRERRAAEAKEAAAEAEAAHAAGGADAPSAPSAERASHDSPAKRALRPLRKTPDKWVLLRGTGPAAVLTKAAALLLLCWIAGAVRYLPTFAELFPQFTLPF